MTQPQQCWLSRESDGFVVFALSARGTRKQISSSAYMDRAIARAAAKGYAFDDSNYGFSVDRTAFVRATTLSCYDCCTGIESKQRVHILTSQRGQA